MVQFSYPYMTMGKTIALSIQTFAGKVMSLLLHMLSRFVMANQVIWEELSVPWDRLISGNITHPLIVYEADSVSQPTGQPFC